MIYPYRVHETAVEDAPSLAKKSTSYQIIKSNNMWNDEKKNLIITSASTGEVSKVLPVNPVSWALLLETPILATLFIVAEVVTVDVGLDCKAKLKRVSD